MIALVSAIAVYCMLPSDEKTIHKNLKTLAEYGSSRVEEPMLETIKLAGLSAKLCSTPFRVRFEAMRIERVLGEKELKNHIIMVKKKTEGTTFRFADIQIRFPGENTAEVKATLQLDGNLRGDSFTDAYETVFTLEKSSGEWLFSSLQVVEFIKR